ncbi:hypothetical protein A9Q83_13575 [Alphaproteobacteria bacterium 46_93_T64]|nr:hypothetical protein A9Q83_13575 [Alphaproteobacteria bacterium 46_93_T64]
MVLLNLPQIAENQASAYITSNDADAALENALCEGKLDYDGSLGDFPISEIEFQKNWFHRVSGTPSSALTVTIPALKRPFMVQNLCGETITLTTSLGDSFPVLSGENRLLYCDGIGVYGLTDTSTTSSIVPAFSGALVSMTSNFTIPHDAVTSVDWDASSYDTDTYFDGANPGRFTVPLGVSKIILRGQLRWLSNLSDTREALFLKNGSATYTGRAYSSHAAQSKLIMNLTSPALDVVPGDYFELASYQNTGADQYAEYGDSSWFSIQAIG